MTALWLAPALAAHAKVTRYRWANAWRLLAVIFALWLAGCAQPGPVLQTEADAWSGRIAVQVEEQASQSFSALFELRGSAETGSLVLTSPLGNRLAQLDWKQGHAQLVSANETRTSHSIDALVQDVTGTAIPVAALFGWLNNTHVAVAGWRADLSGVAEGRLVARRDDPAPPVTLRIALTR